MLVIRRRAGEALLVGDDIEITILEMEPGRVKIGISAPPEVAVVRREIADAARANVHAARPPDPRVLARVAQGLRRGGNPR